jgi:DNA helicase II / ATP-dependent DNA helicase PcrA
VYLYLDLGFGELSLTKERKMLSRKTIKIYGPPGTGKTTTLLNKLDKLFERGVQPYQISYLSFTNKAVNEARTRAAKQFSNLQEEELKNFRTIHSFCRQNFKTKPVIDPEIDMVEFAQVLGLPKLQFEKYNGQHVWNDWSLRVYDKSRNMLIGLEQAYKNEKVKRVVFAKYKLIIEAYNQFKLDHRVDFTDMIEEYIEKGQPPKLKTLIVDEAQDLTPLQWKLIYKLADHADRIFLAGDDDQAIYEWNGADAEEFNKFPGRDFILRKSYRIPSEIHDYSQYIASLIVGRKEKVFIPQQLIGGIYTYNRIKDIPFTADGSWMMLGRTNEIVEELRQEAKNMGLFFQDSKGRKSFDLNKWNAIKIWERLMNNQFIEKEEIQIIYTYINEISFGWRSIESKRWSTVEPDATLNYESLHANCGLEANRGHWTSIFNRNFPEKDKFYFESLIESGKDVINNSNMVVDTIHSIKGGEADHVVLYEKTNWIASIQNKIGLEKSSEYRVWYVGATRAKQYLHILRSNSEYYFPLAKILNEVKRLK